MKRVWPIKDAKNKLEEVVNLALTQGAQLITQNNEKSVAVVAYKEYEKLRKSQGKLSEFFQSSPLAGLTLSRDKSLPRKGIEL